MGNLTKDNLVNGFVVEGRGHTLIVDINRIGKISGSVIVQVETVQTTITGLMDINVSGDDLTDPEIFSRVMVETDGDIPVLGFQNLRDAVELATDIVHYAHGFLKKSLVDKNGYDAEMLARAFKHACTLRDRNEVPAIILGMVPDHMFPELLTFHDFEAYLSDNIGRQDADSPLNTILTNIARKKGILAEDEDAQSYYKKVTEGLAK